MYIYIYIFIPMYMEVPLHRNVFASCRQNQHNQPGGPPALLGRRELALKHQELAAETGLLSSKAQRAEAAVKEGASAARDDEARVLKDHQVYCCALVFVSDEIFLDPF